MLRVSTTSTAAFFVLFLTASARGQSLNVAFGPTNMQPTSIYAAAGLPGYWNAMTAANGTTTFNLKNLAGVSTPVRLYQYGGTQLMHINDPLTSGDDQTLMDHFLVTYTPSLETCLFFNDLQNGVYEVLTYGWMPRNPGIMAYTSSDEEPGYPHEIVGGAWPGGHQELVTYSRHYCIVGPPVNGRLRVHSGIVPGAPAANGAAMNGVQIRKLPAAAPADMNCDGAQDAEDVGIFIQALVDRESYYADHPTCRILNGDLNGDWDIDTDDVAPFVTALLN